MQFPFVAKNAEGLSKKLDFGLIWPQHTMQTIGLMMLGRSGAAFCETLSASASLLFAVIKMAFKS